MSRGVNGQDIYCDEVDRRAFLGAMERRVSESGADILAYCLMGNHFHLAIKVSETPLSAIMQRLLTGYCMVFNLRHDRQGHLFQARHNAKICLRERYLRTVIRYILMNPVRAGLVCRPQDWPWSSCPREGISDDPEIDLTGFNPWSKDDVGCELLRADPVERKSISAIGAEVALRAGVSVELLRSGNRGFSVIEAKRALTREAVLNGHALRAVADWLHVAPSTMTRYFGGGMQRTVGLTPIK